MARPRMLIVEDEQIVAADLQSTLESLGYDVVGAVETGPKAISKAEQSRPDLVLMDIQLKGAMDGLSAAEEIRRRWAIPIVFVTANANDDTLARAKATAPYGYVTKPFRARDLNATIQVALNQHRVVQELFREHAWLRVMLGSLSDGVIATDAGGLIRYLNPAAEDLTGWGLAQAVGRPVSEILVLSRPEGGAVELGQLSKALVERGTVSKERFLLRSKSGQQIPIEDSASAILENEQVAGAVSVFRDITDRLRQEQELEREKDRLEERVAQAAEALGETRAELRALSGHLIAAQEEERRRVARELHDGLGQKAALLEIEVSRSLETLASEGGPGLEALKRIREQISQIGNGLRTVSHGLHPAVLEDIGLIAGLRTLVQELNEAGAEVSLLTPISVEVPLNVATALYRIAQEALRNTIQHAPGAPSRVTLTVEREAWCLKIDDAGPGFDLAQAKANKGLGLLSMNERALLLGGTLTVRTGRNKGTSIVVRVPRPPA